MQGHPVQVQRLEGSGSYPSYSLSQESTYPSHRSRLRPTCHRGPADNSLHEDACDTSTIREADLQEYPRCSATIHPAWQSSSKHHPQEHLAIHANHENEGSSCTCKAPPRRPRKNYWTSG